MKKFFKGFKKGMSSFGNDIATIVNTILLLVVYVVGVGLTSIFAKIFGKRFLDTKISKKKKSYWTTLDLKKRPIDEYYRQF